LLSLSFTWLHSCNHSGTKTLENPFLRNTCCDRVSRDSFSSFLNEDRKLQNCRSAANTTSGHRNLSYTAKRKHVGRKWDIFSRWSPTYFV
jgi:hypothetical protein